MRPATPNSGSPPSDKPARDVPPGRGKSSRRTSSRSPGSASWSFIVLFCFVGPHLYVTNQVDTHLINSLCTPGGSHLLGCDELGYDELGRLMVGGQTSLEVGLAAAIVSVFIGTLYGAISGFAGGFVDSLMMRIVDAGLSLPSLMVIIILSVIFHPTPIVIIFIIAVFYWFGVARLVRGETLALSNREYVQAVKVIGGRPMRSVLRHIVPNAIGTIIVQATFAVADSILTLSVLGFLTLGVAPPDDRLGIDALRRPAAPSRAATTGG